MIQTDQPTGFSPGVLVRVSSKSDGTMLDRTIDSTRDTRIRQRREAFCLAQGIDYHDCVNQWVQYGDDMRYDSIVEVDAPNVAGVTADVLYTETPGVGLFLPVADCIATVVYDPVRRALALAHLGRHSTIARAMEKTLDFFEAHGSHLGDLEIWMAPSVKASHYVMNYFDHLDDPAWQEYATKQVDGIHLDLHGYNISQALSRSISPSQIVVSPVNTAMSPDYFSHSQGDTNGRFAVVAMILTS